VNFDEAADVYWFDIDNGSPVRALRLERQHRFASLKRAVLYVMWNLPEPAQRTAWITTDSARYTMKEIFGLFARLYDDV
jgi:hypothetical protein